MGVASANLATIKSITENFSENCLIGEGGFSTVYKVSLSLQKIDTCNMKVALILMKKEIKHKLQILNTVHWQMPKMQLQSPEIWK